MANIAYKLEYAKTPVYRAAYALANGLASAERNVSHAKIVACEVADLAATTSIQVHGALGYTWELELQILMKRAWALNSSYGTAGFHKQRLAAYVFSDDALLGAGNTFAA
jgi:alkylation response protein AidB-like acyl-CoA dehydrogenase